MTCKFKVETTKVVDIHPSHCWYEPATTKTGTKVCTLHSSPPLKKNISLDAFAQIMQDFLHLDAIAPVGAADFDIEVVEDR